MNCQCDNQCRRDFAEMSRCVRVEVTGRAGRANVMDIFADEEEQRVSRSRRQHCCPPTAVAQTFRQNREERDAQGVPAARLIKAQSGLCNRSDVLIHPPARAKAQAATTP